MKKQPFPKVGDIVYGFQNIEERAGETTFLCSTQTNCTTNLAEGEGEVLEGICYEGLVEIDGKDVPSYDPELGKNLVIWEMKRIR